LNNWTTGVASTWQIHITVTARGEGAWSRVNQSGGDMGPGDGPDSICGPGRGKLVSGEYTGTSFGTPWKTMGTPTIG